MEQDGARIYVYGGSAVVGDNVTVTGTKAEYGEAPQLTNALRGWGAGGAAVLLGGMKVTLTWPCASCCQQRVVGFLSRVTPASSKQRLFSCGSLPL